MKLIQLRASIMYGAILLACVLLAGSASTARAITGPQPGVDDNFYKVVVPQTGLYQITYENLRDAGLPVDSIVPSTLQLFEQGVEIARTVVDGAPVGVFNAGDSLLFYGQVADTAFVLANTYWLTYGRGPGLDMTSRDGLPDAGLPAVTSYRAIIHLEQNTTFRSELPLTGITDRWYLQSYQPTCRLVVGQPNLKTCKVYTFTYPINIPEVATGVYSATLTPRLRGTAATTSTPEHTAIFRMNSVEIGTAHFMYDAESLVSFNFDQSLLVSGTNTFSFTVPVSTTAMAKETPIDQGYINWFEISYQRTYAVPATGQFPFNVDATTPVSVTLTGVTDAATAVYDISDPQSPVLITGVQSMSSVASRLAAPTASSLSFAHQLTAPAQYLAVGSGQYLSPTSIIADVPSDLRGAHTAHAADWIIISHADFLPAAETLAAHRRNFQGLRTEIVDVQQIYDEFNGGLIDQEAIRSFIRYAYENWTQPAPLYVVLLGDGHYDPRCYVCTATSYIPPYLYPVDRFIGVTAADNRYVAYDPVPPEINPAPFMNLGRLPANNLDEANAIINKIISYETGIVADTSWLTKTVFVADDPDYAGNFWAYSTRIVTDTTLLPAEYSREQIYLATGGDVNAATASLIQAINNGALFVNFNGHASYTGWAFEGLWELGDTAALTNTGKYPIMLPMTCLDGYYIYPFAGFESIGEKIVRVPNAGAVASWSPTGKGVAQGHDCPLPSAL